MAWRIKVRVAIVRNRLAATCGEIADNLSGYLEHDLAFPRRRRVAWHLRRCMRCRSLLHSLAWTIEQLRALRTNHVTAPSVAGNVATRIRADSAGRES